jgi:aminoglycoside phosphotransferase
MTTAALSEDAALPAVAHLVGEEASRVLQAVLQAADGRLLRARASHVQYRPGSDAVVRFDATVAWSGGPARRETLLAATSPAGAPVGTVPVTATVDGRNLEIGVWRWPFDPVLGALTTMVTPTLAAGELGVAAVGPLDLSVVAYRPTERAVVRVTDARGTVLYVKVLPPTEVPAVVERHHRLAVGGLPVPEIVASGPGWLAMTELAGPTLRDLVKGDADGTWPTPDRLVDLLGRLRDVELPDHAARSRTDDAVGHAAMLQRVAPELAPSIERVMGALATGRRGPNPTRATVHGDLHEAQLVVSGGRIVGVLDVDDAGQGDPLDDMATLVAHTRFRAVVADSLAGSERLTRYADELVTAFAADAEQLGNDPRDLRLAIAAALVGLATGPFRVQRPHWRHEVAAVLACAEASCTATGRERSLSSTSS